VALGLKKPHSAIFCLVNEPLYSKQVECVQQELEQEQVLFI